MVLFEIITYPLAHAYPTTPAAFREGVDDMHRTEVGWRIKFPLLGLTFALEFTTALAAVFGCVFLTNTVLLDLDKAAWVRL